MNVTDMTNGRIISSCPLTEMPTTANLLNILRSTHLVRICCFLILVVGLFAVSAVQSRAQTITSNLTTVGYIGIGSWGFYDIADFDYDSAGNLYVLEINWASTDCRVSKFTPDGNFERTFGQGGTGYGQISGINGCPSLWNLKVDTTGNINIFYDSPTDLRQWTKFSPTGALIGQRTQNQWIDGLYWSNEYAVWNLRANYVPTKDGGFDVSYRGNFNSPTYANGRWINSGCVVFHIDALFNVTVATDQLDPVDNDGGNLLVSYPDDTKVIVNRSGLNPHVTLYDASWTKIITFGGYGNADGMFNNPVDIKILPSGNLWIHDFPPHFYQPGRYQEFTRDGLLQYVYSTSVPRGYGGPWGFRSRTYGDLFKFKPDGNVALVQRDFRSFIHIDNINETGVWSGGGDGLDPFIEILSKDGNLVHKIGGTPGSWWAPYPIPDISDRAWIMDTEFTGWQTWSRLTFDVTTTGEVVTLSGYSKADQHPNVNPNTNAILRFYGTDQRLKWRIEILDSGKGSLSFWDTQSRYVRFVGGKIYVFVSGVRPRTLVFDTSGNLITEGDPFPKSASNSYIFPTAVYNDSFICNDGRAYKPVFSTTSGSFTWQQTRNVVPGVWEPTKHMQIAVDSRGRTFRTHWIDNRVEVTDWNGNTLPDLVSPDGFYRPIGVAIGPNDSIYVIDHYWLRKFASDGSFISAHYVSNPNQIQVHGSRVYILENGSRIGIHNLDIPDNLAPITTVTATPQYSLVGWSTANAIVSLQSLDNEFGAGVKEIHYSINMGSEQIVISSTATFTLTDNGTHSISFFAVDDVGNTETTQYATVKIDKIAPVTTLSQNAGLITLSATDAHSGVAKIKYQVNGGAVLDYSVPFADTVHKVTYWAEDVAGNVEAAKTDIINAGVQSVSVSQNRIPGGIGVVGTVTLDKAAGFGGTVISLASSLPGVAFVDPTVTVPEGATSTTFDIDANPVAIDTSVSITASIYDTSQSALITVTSPAPVQVTWTTSPVVGGTSTTGTLIISGPAPTGGTTVSLASSSLSALVGSSVTIPAGSMTASFTVSTNAVSNDTSAIISATVYGAKLKSTLSILGPKVTSVTLAASSVVSLGTTTGTVTLSTNAPVGGKVVTLSSSNSSVASVPVSVTVAAGTKTATFTVTAGSVNASSTATITAATNGSTGTASLTVTPPPAAIFGITTNVAAVTGGLAVTGTVTLTSPAPTGGAVIALASTPTTAGTVPANVTVAAGATTATFTITTKTVTAATTLTVTGSYLGVAKVATITVNPARVVSTLILNPTTVKGGTNSTGTITLTGIATENVVVSLTSGTTTVATVPTSVTVLAGSSTATFSITTLAQTATKTSIITAKAGTTSKTATLSVTK